MTADCHGVGGRLLQEELAKTQETGRVDSPNKPGRDDQRLIQRPRLGV